jgi:hypothetical protein
MIKKKEFTHLDREEIRNQRKLHLDLQAEQRVAYDERQVIATKSKPDTTISIILDGIDGRKTILPYFYGQPKSIEGSTKYEFKVITLLLVLII